MSSDERRFLAVVSPHIRGRDDIQRVMWTVVVALLPALFAGCYFFGFSAIRIVVIAVLSAVLTEAGIAELDALAAFAAVALERDWTRPYEASDAVEQAWLQVYRDPQAHWDLYQLGEELTDLEDAFRLWRFRHLTTVERVIGLKRGTGGTSGTAYLRKMLDVVLFPEIWKLRTDL